MTKFVFNGRFLTKRATGVDRFAFETLRALDKLLDETDQLKNRLSFSFAVPADCVVSSPFNNIPIEFYGKLKGLLWEQLELPFKTSGIQLINLCNAAPLFKQKQLVVIHDATPVRFPDTFSLGFRLWYRFMMPVIGKIAKQVCTVSEFSKQEIAACYGIACQKISVIPESGEHILRFEDDEAVLAKYNLQAQSYMFTVSSMAPHKNFKLIFEALKLIDNPQFDMVIAGGVNHQVFADNAEPLPDYVKHVGYVSDAELKTLLQNASWFVFPSIYEGFGIPPLEAMSCGCPVLAAKAASIPEVCADGALYFDPKNAAELAKLLTEVSGRPEDRDAFVKAGRARAAIFTWEQAARHLLLYLEESVL